MLWEIRDIYGNRKSLGKTTTEFGTLMGTGFMRFAAIEFMTRMGTGFMNYEETEYTVQAAHGYMKSEGIVSMTQR